MYVNRDHPDRAYIKVFLDGLYVTNTKVFAADTVLGFIDLYRSYTDRVYGKVELIDSRTGKPYDALYQAAEAASIETSGMLGE